MPSFAAQQSLFRAYDIRGSNQYFTDDFILVLGHAFAQLYQYQDNGSKQSLNPSINTGIDNRTNAATCTYNTQAIVVIGYDMRCGSKAIAEVLSAILIEQGLQVIQLGLVTTPMVAFWAEQYHGHGITVTASHSAKDTLGIKWLVNHKSPSSKDIQALYQLTANLSLADLQNKRRGLSSESIEHNSDNKSSSDATTKLTTKQVTNTYIDAIAKVFQQQSQHSHNNSHMPSSKRQTSASKLDLVVVIDCMHGATGSIAQCLFERFCQHVIVLNATPDGSFPLGNPDPTEPNRLSELQQAVIHHHADIGLAFDGDGDRLMIVDNNSKVVIPDHLLYLLARVAITENHESSHSQLQSQVLFDIKCAHHLPRLLSEIGATPVLSKTGSSFMRQQIQHSNGQIVFAGELSGHFIFNDHRFIAYDDATYASLRLLHWFARTRDELDDHLSVSEIIQRLPAIVSTADHYLPLPPPAMTDCSIMEQLTRFCGDLQHSIPLSAHRDPIDTVSDIDRRPSITDQRLAIRHPPSVCTCASVKSGKVFAQANEYLLPAGTKLSCIDGVRLDFAHGFGVLRQSNTSHSLTARFAGDSIADLKSIQAIFADLCRPFNTELADQIVAIPAE